MRGEREVNGEWGKGLKSEESGKSKGREGITVQLKDGKDRGEKRRVRGSSERKRGKSKGGEEVRTQDRV